VAANLLDRKKAQSFPDVLEKLLLYFNAEYQSEGGGKETATSLKISRYLLHRKTQSVKINLMFLYNIPRIQLMIR